MGQKPMRECRKILIYRCSPPPGVKKTVLLLLTAALTICFCTQVFGVGLGAECRMQNAELKIKIILR